MLMTNAIVKLKKLDLKITIEDSITTHRLPILAGSGEGKTVELNYYYRYLKSNVVFGPYKIADYVYYKETLDMKFRHATESHVKFMIGKYGNFRKHFYPIVSQLLFMHKVDCLEHIKLKSKLSPDFNPLKQGDAWAYMVTVIFKLIEDIESKIGKDYVVSNDLEVIKKNTQAFCSYPQVLLLDDLDAFLDTYLMKQFLDFLNKTFPNLLVIYTAKLH